MSILVKPYCTKTGNFAPSMISFEENPDAAIKDVASRSALGKFKNWSFSRYKKINDNKAKSKFNRDDE